MFSFLSGKMKTPAIIELEQGYRKIGHCRYADDFGRDCYRQEVLEFISGKRTLFSKEVIQGWLEGSQRACENLSVELTENNFDTYWLMKTMNLPRWNTQVYFEVHENGSTAFFYQESFCRYGPIGPPKVMTWQDSEHIEDSNPEDPKRRSLELLVAREGDGLEVFSLEDLEKWREAIKKAESYNEITEQQTSDSTITHLMNYLQFWKR